MLSHDHQCFIADASQSQTQPSASPCQRITMQLISEWNPGRFVRILLIARCQQHYYMT